MTVESLYSDVMRRGILPALEAAGIEPDQRLRRAFETSRVTEGNLWPFIRNPVSNEVDVLAALCRSNGAFTRALGPGAPALLGTYERGTREQRNPQPAGAVLSAGPHLAEVLIRAAELRRNPQTLASQDFLRAAVESPRVKSFVAQAVGLWGPDYSVMFELVSEYCTGVDDDFQYILALADGRIAFRPISVLGDYCERTDAGLIVQHRALLTHLSDDLGGFTEEEILEFEDLVNDGSAKEKQFQDFFETHPHFLRIHDYREIHSHVVLHRVSENSSLVPDFILTDRDAQRAAILELKLPSARLVRHQDNRCRFAAVVGEAAAQLRTYGKYFRDPACRERIASVVGMRIYEPTLFVLIGRSSEFQSDVERQELRADHPGVEVVTYDDILTRAGQRKRLLLGS